MMFSLSDETKDDIVSAGLGDPSLLKFLKAFFLYPEFNVLYRWKIARKLFHKGKACRLLSRIIMVRILSTYNCDLSMHAKIGKRIHFVHPFGITVGEQSEIGDDVKIHQHVTIGRNYKGGVSQMPKIGNGVIIYAGAVIAGDITIGDQAVIGANAVLTKDVPTGAIVVAPKSEILPAKKPKKPKLVST